MGYTLNGAATANAFGRGAVVVVFNVISACRLIDEGQGLFNILLGTCPILSRYSPGLATERELALNACVVGTMIVALAAWQIYDATKGEKK